MHTEIHLRRKSLVIHSLLRTRNLILPSNLKQFLLFKLFPKFGGTNVFIEGDSFSVCHMKISSYFTVGESSNIFVRFETGNNSFLERIKS